MSVYASAYRAKTVTVEKPFAISGGTTIITTENIGNANGQTIIPARLSVTVDSGIVGGTVVPDKAAAYVGDTVTLEVTPATHYGIGTVRYNDGSDHTITPVEGAYSFTMPASNVTVTATFDMDSEWAALQVAISSAAGTGGTVDASEYDYDDDGKIIARDGEMTLQVSSGTVTLDLNGITIDRGLKNKAAALDGCVIFVGGNLTVTDSTATGDDPGTGKITGSNNLSSNGGGGVYVGSNGKFTLQGGSILENKTGSGGGGVVNNGEFTMTGGAISDNVAYGHGGGVVNNYLFTMSGGTISGNRADDDEGTASNSGGGVYNGSLGTFTMSNDAIDDNVADFNGGGVSNYGTFNMSGGTISENSAPNGGGGVLAYGTFNLSGGEITGNHATGGDNGGGVYVNSDSFNLSGNPVVTDNDWLTEGVTKPSDVYLNESYLINIGGALT